MCILNFTFVSLFLFVACLGIVATFNSGLEIGKEASVLETDGVAEQGSGVGVDCFVDGTATTTGAAGLGAEVGVGLVTAGLTPSVEIALVVGAAATDVWIFKGSWVSVTEDVLLSTEGSTAFTLTLSSFFSVSRKQ